MKPEDYQIIEFMGTEGYKKFKLFLEKLEKMLTNSPQLYYEHPELAGYHAGGLYTVSAVKRFFNSLKQKAYAEAKSKLAEGGGDIQPEGEKTASAGQALVG